jgi:hypothetical protein
VALSRKATDKLALQIVTADRQLARQLLAATRRQIRSGRGSSVERIVLLAASLVDALDETETKR